MAYNYGNYNNGYNMNYGGYPNNVNGTGGMSYTQGYGQNQMPAQTMQMPQQNYSQSNMGHTGINWVQGRAGANSFYVSPGQSALLMDSEESVLYVKTVDTTGRPLPLEVYDLVKRENVVEAPQISQRAQQASAPDMSQYVRTDELEAVVKKIVDKALAE